jgi:sugar O-acyltransferase (sialic acid O-acetyltransferase NeuD family)
MKPVLILAAGSGAHARVLYDACLETPREIASWIKAADVLTPPSDSIRLLGDVHLLDDRPLLSRHDIAIGVGNEQQRRSLAERVLGNGGTLATIIHPSSVVSRSAAIGAGTVVLAGAVIGVGARVGRFCIVNTAATVDHDCELADGVNLCPGAHLSGAVRIGEDTFIGTGASVLPGIRIGARATIGAGAVVIRDVADNQTVAGVPAREIKRSR